MTKRLGSGSASGPGSARNKFGSAAVGVDSVCELSAVSGLSNHTLDYACSNSMFSPLNRRIGVKAIF